MEEKQIKWLVQTLKNKGILFSKGLDKEEIEEVKKVFDIEFPDDLEALLKYGQPEHDSFVHWRHGINSDKGKREILQRINAPLEGILFSVKLSEFWFDGWGKQTKRFSEQETIIKTNFATYPKLIPIYSHRYIASTPKMAGNPIFSIHGTDIIYYGMDLMDYLSNEFGFKLPERFEKINEPAYIQFWSDIVS